MSKIYEIKNKGNTMLSHDIYWESLFLYSEILVVNEAKTDLNSIN